MLFWIIIILIVAAIAYSIWAEGDWLMGIPILLLGTIFGGVVLMLCAMFIPSNVDLMHEEKTSLKALGTSSTQHGRFFLGSGYIDGKRVLNYIQQANNGSLRVSQADAEDSIIFEDATNATVTIRHFDYSNGWILPWPIGSTDKYEFHIPAGSVTESYTIDNE